MAENTDAYAITFARDQVRPVVEELRNLRLRYTAFLNEWSAGVPIDNTADTIAENRTDGKPDVTGANVFALVAILETIETQLGTAAARKLMSRVATRPPSVS